MGPELWQQQPGESATVYAHFQVFRDMGPKRTLRAVAAKCGIEFSSMRRHSAKHDWYARARAYDAFVDGRVLTETSKMQIQYLGERIELVEAVRSKRLKVVNMGLEWLEGQLAYLLEKGPKSREHRINPNMVIQALTELAKTTRLETGESTENVSNKVTGAIEVQVFDYNAAIAPITQRPEIIEGEVRALLTEGEGEDAA